MPNYRVFTNDRGPLGLGGIFQGVPLYSCYVEGYADSYGQAVIEMAPPMYDRYPFAPTKVMEWPPTSKSSKDWLKKHVSV